MKKTEAAKRICIYMSKEIAKSMNGSFLCATTNCMAWAEYESQEFKIRADREFQKSGKRLKLEDGYCSLMRNSPREAF